MGAPQQRTHRKATITDSNAVLAEMRIRSKTYFTRWFAVMRPDVPKFRSIPFRGADEIHRLCESPELLRLKRGV
jgi:hypothetical protein